MTEFLTLLASKKMPREKQQAGKPEECPECGAKNHNPQNLGELVCSGCGETFYLDSDVEEKPAPAIELRKAAKGKTGAQLLQILKDTAELMQGENKTREQFTDLLAEGLPMAARSKLNVYCHSKKMIQSKNFMDVCEMIWPTPEPEDLGGFMLYLKFNGRKYKVEYGDGGQWGPLKVGAEKLGRWNFSTKDQCQKYADEWLVDMRAEFEELCKKARLTQEQIASCKFDVTYKWFDKINPEEPEEDPGKGFDRYDGLGQVVIKDRFIDKFRPKDGKDFSYENFGCGHSIVYRDRVEIQLARRSGLRVAKDRLTKIEHASKPLGAKAKCLVCGKSTKLIGGTMGPTLWDEEYWQCKEILENAGQDWMPLPLAMVKKHIYGDKKAAPIPEGWKHPDAAAADAQPSKKLEQPRQVAAGNNRDGGPAAAPKKRKQTALDKQIEDQKAVIKVVEKDHPEVESTAVIDLEMMPGKLAKPQTSYTLEQINDHITKDGRLKCLGCHHLMAMHVNGRAKCGGSVCKCQEFVNPHRVAESMGLQKKGELVYFVPEEKKKDSMAANTTAIAIMPINAIKVALRYRKDLGDLQTLADSIKKVGLLHPIVVSATNELIAGQRRLEACKLLGWSEVPVHKINLKQIVLGEFHENAVRKDFLVTEMVAIARSIEPAERLAALERMKRGKPSAKLSEGQTRDKVARFVNVSHATLTKAEKVVEAVERDPATFGRLLEKIDTGNYSIDKAYKQLQRHEKINKLVAENSKIVIPNGIKLLHGKFQDHASEIADNSIDLIFTDPPYLREDLPIYEELAKLATRVLKPGGSLVAYTGNYALPEIIDYMRKADLTYWWTIAIVHESYGANLARVWHRQVVAAWKPALWFVKGNKLAKPDFIKDLVYSKRPDKDLHDWAQSHVEAEHVIARLTVEGAVVCDPMMGSGPVGIAAVRLKRRFIGIETLKEKYEIAKASIAHAVKSSQLRPSGSGVLVAGLEQPTAAKEKEKK